MKLNDPQSWSLPTETVEVDDPKLGRVRVTRWSEYHFRQSAQRPMEMIRVEVLESRDGKRRFAPLVGLVGRDNAAFRDPLAELLTPLCDRTLVPLRQAAVILDTSSVHFIACQRTLEQPHAPAQLATLARTPRLS